MRNVIPVLAALLAVCVASPTSCDQAVPGGESEFRAAWIAFTAPSQGPAESRTPDTRQQARIAALGHIEAAVRTEPSNAAYQTSLAYICLAAGDYARAKEASTRAVELEPHGPLPHLLRGQAEAALAQTEPERAAERIGPSLEAFDRAARLDPINALPLLEGAGVAFEVGRNDLARARIDQALARTKIVLYRLPIPFDLHEERAASVKAWQYAQYGQWLELLRRCQNASRGLLRFGAGKLQAGEVEAAEEHSRKALAVGRLAGMAEPNVIITVNAGINMLEDAYVGLLQVAEAQESREAERWSGELGVLQVGRAQLYGVLQAYTEALENSPPESVEGMLKAEAKQVEGILLGIGLTPAADK